MMKKTIASVAMLVSSQAALAMPLPPDPSKPKPVIVTSCIQVYEGEDGSKYGGCDQSRNNQIQGLKVGQNGCTSDQVSLQFQDKSPIAACMPPGVVQL